MERRFSIVGFKLISLLKLSFLSMVSPKLWHGFGCHCDELVKASMADIVCVHFGAAVDIRNVN